MNFTLLRKASLKKILPLKMTNNLEILKTFILENIFLKFCK